MGHQPFFFTIFAPKFNSMKKRPLLSQLLLPFKGRFFLIFILNLISVALTILTFLTLEPLVSLLFTGSLEQSSPLSHYIVNLLSSYFSIEQLYHSIYSLSLFIIILFFLKNLFFVLSQFVMAPIKSSILQDLRNRIYYKLTILPLSFYKTGQRGDLISRAVNDTQEVEFTIMQSIYTFLMEPIAILIYLGTLIVISPHLTLFVAILLPISAYIISRVSRKLRKRTGLAKLKLGSLFSHVEETVSGIKIIKGFQAQSHSEQVFKNLNDSFTELQKKIYRKVELASPVSEFLGVTVVMLILIYGGVRVLEGSLTLSAPLFIVYIALFTQIINPAKNLAAAVANLRRGQAAIDRINELLDAEEVILEKENPISITQLNDKIEYENVSFQYEDTPVISDFSLTINKGEFVALVGPSGSGKSTLVDLLPRFYDPHEGIIRVDGVPIQDYRIDQLRSLYGIVTQDVVLFNDTVLNNITYGLDQYDMDDVIKATQIASAYDFIMKLPNQFETVLSDRGLSLSGGERQRLSIARAIMHNPSILIFDEATSALDSESEIAVQAAMEKLIKHNTMIVVAHRLSTIQKADKIVVMDQGKIVEMGSHDELLELKGYYWTMCQRMQDNNK